MRSVTIAIIAMAFGISIAAADMTPADRDVHAANGLMTMYAAGMVCFYNKWSFSKADTDEMLQKIQELQTKIPKATSDGMWARAQTIMAEGQASANQERCGQVRERYMAGRPFLLGTQPQAPGKTP